MFQPPAFAFGVLADINGFDSYTSHSSGLSHPLAQEFFWQLRGWAPEFNQKLFEPSADALRPIKPDNAWGTRITAPAGTSLGAPYS